MKRKRITSWNIKSSQFNIDTKICNLAEFSRIAKINYGYIMNKIQTARKENYDFIQFDHWTISWVYHNPLEALLKLKKVASIAASNQKRAKKNVVVNHSWYKDHFRGRPCIN
jgi:hypothetical protein